MTSTALAEPGHRAAARLAGRTRTWVLLRGALGGVAALTVWEASSRSGLVDGRYLPPPSTVVPRALTLLADPVLLDGLTLTVTTWLAGIAVAAALAIPAGALLGAFPALELATTAFVEVLRPIPAVALLPVVILAFGIDTASRACLVVFAATWPILLNTIAGIRSCDPAMIDVARVHGHRRLSILARVRLPAAAPLIATGLRISTSIALIATISLELVTGTDEGLGGYLVLVASGGATDTVLAVTVLAGLLGLAANTATAQTERALFGWHHSQRQTAS